MNDDLGGGVAVVGAGRLHWDTDSSRVVVRVLAHVDALGLAAARRP